MVYGGVLVHFTEVPVGFYPHSVSYFIFSAADDFLFVVLLGLGFSSVPCVLLEVLWFLFVL